MFKNSLSTVPDLFRITTCKADTTFDKGNERVQIHFRLIDDVIDRRLFTQSNSRFRDYTLRDH
ncbi:MAG: hypothetical protein DWI24_07700 [Planctomycetota bacterium]|nr:MAG: hypothetical protein DWI24_07700 [Planctomycetota bacterium]